MKKNRSLKTKGIALLILVGLAGCKSSVQPAAKDADSRPADIGRGWKRIDAGEAFLFWVPGEMEQQRATGIDSLVGDYRSTRMRITFDYGRYSNPLTNYSSNPGCDEETKSISGKDARIVECKKAKPDSSFSYLTAIHFAEVHEAAEGAESMKLTMEVEFNEEDERERARKILESIVFK